MTHVATAPVPETTDSRRRTPLLSELLWNLRWEEHLPERVTQDGVMVVHSDFERALPFIVAHYAEIFQDDPSSPFASAKLDEAKARYYRAAGDFFEFVHAGRTVGLLVGTPVDWSTYYIRSAASLREYQGKKMIQRFFPKMFALLKSAGVERVEAHTSPSNMATLHLLTRLRFNVTGSVLSERWGAHVHFTRFLDDDRERTFLDQFCTGVRYQLREHPALAMGK